MEHATKSTNAELAIVELQHLLANSKIDSGWHGTAQRFLFYWNDNVRKLRELSQLISITSQVLRSNVQGLSLVTRMFGKCGCN